MNTQPEIDKAPQDIRMNRKKATDLKFQCTICNKSFEIETSLLRHISHSSKCQDGYPPEFLEKKRQLRNCKKAKKWYDKLSKEQKHQRYRKRKKGYVSVSRRRGDEGKCFEKLFEDIFWQLDDLNRKIWHEVCDHIYPTVSEICLDIIFDYSDVIESFFETCNDEESWSEKFEDEIEKTFDELISLEIDSILEVLVPRIEDEIGMAKVGDLALNNAFSKLFEKFCKDQYQKASDSALDILFESSPDWMESNYYMIKAMDEKDVWKANMAFEDGFEKKHMEIIQQEIKNFVVIEDFKSIIDKSISKEVKSFTKYFMKSYDDCQCYKCAF